MPKAKAQPPVVKYEEADPTDTKALEDAFNFLFDKYFKTKGQSP